MKTRSEKGFTLLELIIVVAIVGLISSIAVPQYFAFRTKAKLANAMSTCRSIYQAFNGFYLEESNDYMYPSNTTDGNIDDFVIPSFKPLTDKGMMGGAIFNFDNVFLDFAASKYLSNDGDYQQFYLVIPFVDDPSLLFVIASSDDVRDADDNQVDAGLWIDGVILWDKVNRKIVNK